MENWKIGKYTSVVVTDSIEGFNKNTGHLEASYYGGTLVCESVWRKKDAHLISAAPDMLEALQNLENDNGCIPQHAWELVQKAIGKATGK